MQLRGAVVTIESINDAQVVGSFSYEQREPHLTDGKFRAIIKNRKSKPTKSKEQP